VPADVNSRCARVGRVLILALYLAPIVALTQAVTGVGFAPIVIHDPVNGGTMPGYVFYPSMQAKGVTWRGPYELQASIDARPVPGAKPLVVIAHGHGGSDLGHHDLAVYLAGHGFVTATLEFPEDNFHDSSGDGQAVVMGGRPIQVSATITMLLADSRWKNLIAADRIGVAGFSAGGYTSLLLVGAVPRFDRFIDYCERYPDDKGTCGLVKQLPILAPGMSEKGYAEVLQKTFTRWGKTDDPRVRAAFVMAPQSISFDEEGLATINRPVLLYYAQHDQVLLPQENVLHIAPLIKTLIGTKMIPEAGHYVFLAPCSPQLTKDAPEICNDPPGVNRVEVHAQINADALTFFRKTLVASPP
jgi:predicted dienelactone hydrolase